MVNSIAKADEIKGWGIDANPEDKPAYPMKENKDGDHDGLNWIRPEQQPINVEILHSNERPNVTAVFGTSTPPRGLSGIIRRFAFKYSESSYGHWLPLLLADRINVVEGIFQDLARGHIPNIFAEMGLRSELKYNRPAFMRKVAVSTGAVVLAALIFKQLKKRP